MEHHIRILSPFHIGKGNVLQVSDYTILDGQYFRVDVNKIFAFLARFRKVDAVLNEIERTSVKLEKEKDNKEKSQIRKELDILDVCRKIDPALSREIAQRIGEYSLYQMKSELPEDEYGKLIDEQLKTADNQVYIPGSTIKGAIRTVLLVNVMEDLEPQEKQLFIDYLTTIINDKEYSQTKDSIRRMLEKINDDSLSKKKKKEVKTELRKLEGKLAYRKRYLFQRTDDELVQIAFHCGVMKKGKPDLQDAKYDLLKLLFVQDSATKLPDTTLSVVNLKRYATSEEIGFQNIHNPCEAIQAGNDFPFAMGISMDFLLNAKKRLETAKVKDVREGYVFGKNVWIDIEKKLKRLFNVDLRSIDKKNLEDTEHSVVDHIYACCRKFSRLIINHELRWIGMVQEQTGSSAELEFLQRFYTQLDLLEKEGALLLKTGFGAGFHAKTVMLAMMLDETPENQCLKDLMQRFLEVFEVGKPKNYHDSYSVNLDIFPTSRPFIDNEPVIDCFGWVQLHHEPISKEQQNILTAIEQMREASLA